MTAPSSIPVRGPVKTTLARMLASIPATARRRPEAQSLARETFRMCKKAGLNPLVAWAIVIHETGNFSSDAWGDLLNPCGLWRTDFTGYQAFTSGIEAARALVVHILIYEQGKAGMFGLYRHLDPGAGRVVDKHYNGTVKTIEDFRHKWAEDPQWPEGVVARYNAVRTMQLPEPGTPEHTYRFRTSIIPAGNPNRPGLRLDPQFFIVHETANRSIGADAEMHRVFTHNGGGPENVSFHSVADDVEVIQLLEYNEVGWQAGDGYYGPGNRQGESLEICVNADGDWNATKHNAAHYVADRLHARGWSIAHLRPGQHYDFSGKNCPARLRGEGWDEFVALVTYYYQ